MTHFKKVLTILFAFLAVGAIISSEAKRPSRIWGGRLTTDNEFTAAVSLTGLGNHLLHGCGGAIIGPRFVLTAAHCFDKTVDTSDVTVRAGIHNVRDSENAVERLVSKVFIHPGYIPHVPSVQDDIAVLVLKEPLPIGGRIGQFKLPTKQPEDGFYFVCGWGKSGAKPPVLHFELKTLTMRLGHCNGVPGTICATDEKGSTCSGDSGSPLVRGGYVYGLVSTGVCVIGAHTTFASVFHYIDWINDIISTN